MLVTSSRLTPRSRLRRDLSPRRIAGVTESRKGRDYPGHVQVLILDKTRPAENRAPSVLRARTNGQTPIDAFQLPHLVVTSPDESPRRPATTIPELTNFSSNCSEEDDSDELSVNAIDLVAMANDEHRSSSSMTRHKMVEHMVDRGQFSPRPHSVAVTEKIMEDKYLNLKYKRNPCLRAESILNEELSQTINDMSRECCDVFGPNMCQECHKIYSRNDNLVRNESYFPSLNISTQSLSTLTLVRRHLPDCSPWQLQRMIADGDINELAIRRDRMEDAARDFDRRVLDNLSKRTKARLGERRISAFNVPDKQTFFSSISDLRAQIERRKKAGRWGRRQALFNLIDDDETPGHIPQEIDIEPTLSDNIDDDRLGPPLMSREEMEYQHSQPRFYAGGNFDYELPKPPPMAELVERATAAMSLMENTNAAKIGGLEALADNPEIDAWRKARQNYEKEKREKALKEKQQNTKVELYGIQEQSDTEETNSVDENRSDDKTKIVSNDNEGEELSNDNQSNNNQSLSDSQSHDNQSSRDNQSSSLLNDPLDNKLHNDNDSKIRTITLSRNTKPRSRRKGVVAGVLVKPIIEEEPEVIA
ncbi:uncharacterized protein LOC144452940 [Glandiceps talaboti]